MINIKMIAAADLLPHQFVNGETLGKLWGNSGGSLGAAGRQHIIPS